ncbi:MAG: restriction endonuclease subunit S [Actinobacteria bacterium]|nr:restriction endonuclease subunit S [Actinomycetota bacterium]MCG2808319.1 restriction endonuclease subunit S [Coriobacteriia bacterium]
MSRLDELIAELCPDGVAHHVLGDIASYATARVNPNAIVESAYVGVENLRQNAGGRDDAASVPGYGALVEYRFDDILIGNIRPYLKKIWLADRDGGTNGDVLVVRALPEYRELILPRFLYFLLSSDAFFAYDMQHAKGAKMPRGDKAAILRYRIPVPPIEVQREIARILDLFTTLEAELEAELEARGVQYAHYRDSLLAFRDVAGIRWTPMGELGQFHRGRRFTKRDVVEDGIPAIHYGEIYTRYGAVTRSVATHLQPELASGLRYAKHGDVVIVDVGETVEDVGKAVAWLGEGDIAIHDHSFAFRHSENPAYLSYYLQTATFQRDKAKYVARTKVKTLSMPGIAKIPIPVPPLEEQERIVAILDKFNALVNDLSFGLPAELAARRKQYEHYRDKLLTFKVMVA